MTSALHDQQTYAEGIHSIVAYVYDDSTDRETATGFTSADLWKVARQIDDNTFWILMATTPTWQQVGEGSGDLTSVSAGLFGNFGATAGDTSGEFLHPRNNTTSATEAVCFVVAPCAGTLRFMGSRITGTQAASVLLTFRINGVDTATTYTHPGSTVAFSDSASSLAVAAGDFISIKLGTLMAGGTQMYFSVSFIPDDVTFISGSAGGSNAASYLTLNTTGSLLNERVLTVSGSTGLLMIDRGANTAVTMSIDNNVVATLSGSVFSGPIIAIAAGLTGSLTGTVRGPWLSGSLTRLESGLSYLVAGTNVTITSSSTGQVVVSSAGGGGGSGGFVDGINRLKSTGSVSISGPDNVYADEKGNDVFFYVSGTIGLSGSTTNVRKSVFGGDSYHSGSLLVAKTVAFASEINLGNKGSASPVFDLRLGLKLRATLTGSLTASIVDPPGACNIQMVLIQDSIGSRTIKWPASFKFPTSGTIPTLSTLPNSVDIMSLYFNGSGSYYGMASLQFL